MRVAFDNIPIEIVEQYKLQKLVHAGGIYMEIRTGMSGSKQAGKVANDRLVEHLTKYGYSPVPQAPALWRHHNRDITFTLCVNNFGVKYTNKPDVEHLLNALHNLCTISVE